MENAIPLRGMPEPTGVFADTPNYLDGIPPKIVYPLPCISP